MKIPHAASTDRTEGRKKQIHFGVGDFNSPHTIIDRSSVQEINTVY